MQWLPIPFRGLGAAGAAANAQDELESAHLCTLQAGVVVRRVNRSRKPGEAPSPAAMARVA